MLLVELLIGRRTLLSELPNITLLQSTDVLLFSGSLLSSMERASGDNIFYILLLIIPNQGGESLLNTHTQHHVMGTCCSKNAVSCPSFLY